MIIVQDDHGREVARVNHRHNDVWLQLPDHHHIRCMLSDEARELATALNHAADALDKRAWR